MWRTDEVHREGDAMMSTHPPEEREGDVRRILRVDDVVEEVAKRLSVQQSTLVGRTLVGSSGGPPHALALARLGACNCPYDVTATSRFMQESSGILPSSGSSIDHFAVIDPS